MLIEPLSVVLRLNLKFHTNKTVLSRTISTSRSSFLSSPCFHISPSPFPFPVPLLSLSSPVTLCRSHSPFLVAHSPFSIPHSTFPVQNSPSLVSRSPNPVHNSPFVFPRSPFSIPYFLFPIPHSSIPLAPYHILYFSFLLFRSRAF